MAQVQAGDGGAYEALFHRHHARVYGYLVRRTRDREIAADLYQETFLRVFRARDQFQPGRAFRPWLFGIAANTARDRVRRENRRPMEVPLAEWDAPVHAQPDARLHLEKAVAELPDALRDAFLLGVVEGFDHREIAAALDITPANARARVSRARRQLRDALSEGT
jgi:RNA polymerase sigma factor (sigma-70 family)